MNIKYVDMFCIVLEYVFVFVLTTGAVLANKTEATSIVITTRWPLTNNLNVRWEQVSHTEI